MFALWATFCLASGTGLSDLRRIFATDVLCAISERGFVHFMTCNWRRCLSFVTPPMRDSGIDPPLKSAPELGAKGVKSIDERDITIVT